MINLLRRRDLRASIALALSLAAAFGLHWDYLHKGFYKLSPDDYDWIKLKLSAAMLWKVLRPEGMGWFYRPVFLTWMMLFHQFAPYSSTALHAGSLVLFALTVFGVGVLVARITRSDLAGLLAAGLFLTAPAMDEAIWWISSSSTLLATVFSLAALNLLITWRASGRRRYFVLTLAAMALAVGSKEDASTLPLILIALDVFLAHRAGILAGGVRGALRRFGSSSAAILAGMAIYGYLDLTAYHQANISGAGTTRLWHGLTLDILHKTTSFGAQTLFFDHLGSPIGFQVDSIVVFAALIAVVLIGFRRSPLVMFALVAGLLGFSPVPIATGAHVFSARFWYLPNMYGVILCVAIIVETLRSARFEVRLIGAALLIDAMIRHIPLPALDPFVLWIIDFSVALIAFAFWRLVPATGRLALWVSAMSLTWLIIQITVFDVALTPAFLCYGVLYGAALRERRAIPISAALGVALSLAPLWSLFILLAFAYWKFAPAARGRILPDKECAGAGE